jgi:hypothetical protein
MGAEERQAEYDECDRTLDFERGSFLQCAHALQARRPREVDEATTAALDGIGTTETTDDMRGMGSPSEPLLARAARQHEK